MRHLVLFITLVVCVSSALSTNVLSRKRKSIKPKTCPTFSRCQALNSTRNAVCGSDNKTYNTFCHFKVMQCRSGLAGKNLTLSYRGVCGKPKTKMTCALVSQCVNRSSPICGSDGKTYQNLCHFLIAKCEARKQKKRIRLRYRGRCGSPTTPRPCKRRCPRIWKPVCGTNGRTYQNGCWMSKIKCRLPKGKKRYLRLKHRGACVKPCLKISHCNKRKRRVAVCGTDHNSYRSRCHLRIAKCVAKRNKEKTIGIKHVGHCITEG